jgi:hypothetical protein
VDSAAEVLLAIRPEPAPSRLQQHDRAGPDGTPALLEALHVVYLQAVASIASRLLTHVDANRRCYQLSERHGVDRMPIACKMDRRVEMRAAVLGRAEPVGRIKPAARRLAVRELLELELRRWLRRPVERLFAVRVTEVDQAKACNVERGTLGRLQRDQVRKHQGTELDGHLRSLEVNP